jgi:hypothetical protein
VVNVYGATAGWFAGRATRLKGDAWRSGPLSERTWSRQASSTALADDIRNEQEPILLKTQTLAVGWAPRLLSVLLAFAYFIGHAPRNLFPALNGGDAAILYCFVFLYMSAAGGDVWSLDHARERKSLGVAGCRSG